jgi:hypothetical protein
MERPMKNIHRRIFLMERPIKNMQRRIFL